MLKLLKSKFKNTTYNDFRFQPGWISVAMARLKMAEPAEPSQLEPSQAENRLMTKTGSAQAHEPAELG